MQERKAASAPFAAGIIAAGLIVSIGDIWLNIFRFGNGCIWRIEEKEEFAELFGTGFDIKNSFVVSFYLIFSLVVLVLARFDKAFVVWSERRKR